MNIDYAEMLGKLRGVLDGPGEPQHVLYNTLVNASAMRGFLLTYNYVKLHGDAVFTGPFKGMRLSNDIMPNFLLSRYVGAYEHELAPTVSAAAALPYDDVINIGCAEGYYAVGMARLMPNTRVHAFDILASAREKCARLAALNGVADRLRIGELFTPERFADFAGRRALVICDIEGGEFSLLDPVASPALADMDLIVEIHTNGADRTAESFQRRFEDTHIVTPIGPTHAYQGELPYWLYGLSEFDVHLASSSFRPSPTPWVSLRSRKYA